MSNYVKPDLGGEANYAPDLTEQHNYLVKSVAVKVICNDLDE